MNKKFAKTIFTLTFASITTLFSYAHAETNNDVSENIEVTQQGVTIQELAAIQVLSEICPKLIDKKEESSFSAGYSRLVKDYMTDEANPEAALKKLSREKSFQAALIEARSDAKKAGDQQNRDVCEDVKNYHH